MNKLFPIYNNGLLYKSRTSPPLPLFVKDCIISYETFLNNFVEKFIRTIIFNLTSIYDVPNNGINSIRMVVSFIEESFIKIENRIRVQEFVDQQIIPKKNWILFFSSKEVHRVLAIKTGIRKNILIKFY